MEIYDRSRVIAPEKNSQPREISADVCVIGTGAGGAAFAYEAAVLGRKVVMLEEGFYSTGEDFKDRSPSDVMNRVYRDAGVFFSTGNAHILIPLGKCVGGTTVINSGTALRMTCGVFDRDWKEGLDEISWEDLVQAYEKVEKLTSISVVPESLIGKNMDLVRQGAEKIGLAPEPMIRNHRDCIGSARCFWGCPVNAKLSTNLTYVPLALKEGAKLYVGCRAEKILTRGNVATGVQAHLLDQQGEVIGRLIVKSPIVVVACGALITPIFLKKSGLFRGPGYSYLGRYGRIHPASRVVSLFDDKVNMWEGVPQAMRADHFLESEGISIEGISLPPSILAATLPWKRGAMKRMMSDFSRLAVCGVRTVEQKSFATVQRSRLTGGPVVKYDYHLEDIARMQKGIALAARMHFEAGAREVYIPAFRHEILRSMDDLIAFQAKELRHHDLEISAYHPFGTSRMSMRPEEGLVNQRGQYWGMKGLYVCDASIFPTSTYVNPQETIMALSSLFAKRLN